MIALLCALLAAQTGPAGAPMPAAWKRPAYSKPESFHEREVTVGSDEWKLGGTLTLPVGDGPFPAVVLVHGPGPDDRDESIYANRIFRDLAEGLASRGIAVLRYDKRTKVYGQKMGDIDFTLQQETIEDALQAIALARGQKEIDPRRVFVLGHSLGGYASPRIAKQDGKLAGLVLLAANARPIEDVVLEQNEYLAHLGNEANPEALRRLDRLRTEVGRVKNLQPGKSNPPVVLGLPASYLLDLKGYDPAAEAKRLSLPMLVLQGERDFQVTLNDFDRWKSALATRGDVAFQTFPSLNHLFIAGAGPGSPAEYRYPGNVADEAVSTVANWVLRQKHRL